VDLSTHTLEIAVAVAVVLIALVVVQAIATGLVHLPLLLLKFVWRLFGRLCFAVFLGCCWHCACPHCTHHHPRSNP
jgi:hypothetical protein